MGLFLVQVVRITANVLSFLVIIHVFISYILSPYHPVRIFIDRIVEPLLTPIRKVLPTTGMFDFSPIVLILLIQVVEIILISLFAGFG